MAVAAAGEAADPPIPAPAELRPILRFRRLSEASYAVVRRVVDEDGTFRARVAEEADEADVGRLGWLWLHRPMDWLEDPAVVDGVPPVPAASDRGTADREAMAKVRARLEEAERERREARDEASRLRREVARVQGRIDEAEAASAVAVDERNAAVRRSKDLEAELAETRRDLKLAREATRQAEAELAEARAAGAERSDADVVAAADHVDPRADEATASTAFAPSPSVPELDRGAVAAQVADAARAASDLAAALAAAASALAPPPEEDAPTERRRAAADGGRWAGAPTTGARPRARRRRARAQPTLPPGVHGGTPEAHRHLVGDGANLLVVDGYNLARATWSQLAPEEERRRTVALLEDLQARSGGTVVVVFDGDDSVAAPAASRSVRVRFSSTGQTADEAIAVLVAEVPDAQPVVVVSSDREVADDARRLGAVALSSPDLLAAAGR